MKNNCRPLRLGSFEQLESRALLAHAGMPNGMGHENFDQRQFTDFQRTPAMESRNFGPTSARGIFGSDFGSYDHGPRSPRDFGGDFNPPPRTFDPPASAPTGYISSSVSLVTIYIPPPTMIVIITIPAPSPQFSEPLTSSVKAPAQRQTQSTSFSSPPTTHLQSSSSRSSSNIAAPLDSLSVLSSLSLKRPATESTSDESEDASTVSDTRDDQTTRDDQDASPRATSADATQQPQSTTADVDETDLFELDPEELLKRAKRKIARTPTTPPIESKLRESAVRDAVALRVPERHAESRLMLAEVEQVIAPVDDDLIELLAADQVDATQPQTVRSQPFAAASAVKLEANLGFYQAVETTEAETAPATIPAALPAEVATALPARAAE